MSDYDERKFPEMCNRDWSLPHNMLHPLSSRDSGTHLDECCGATIQESSVQQFFHDEYFKKEIR
jgi:hypothetical protein